ncbi:CCC motif membrane protein [Robiginitalea marina]|uniref:CD225/dispanin family protein n=1 Tax=Robiginitalea marina TaxID=2954105 RepID=A0ABT1AWH4_9FLAO|nr:CCC motif membrane protein [Robiginitalea marina]MCO5723975.1 CD225/dispanin family protein [Robiginitalea marina]
MEQQKLPNVTLALVLGILSFLCCCFAGLPGALVAAIAFFILRNDEKTYRANPENYSNYSQLKTAKIIAIVGMVIGVLYFLWSVFQIYQIGGWDAYMEKVQEMSEQWGGQN